MALQLRRGTNAERLAMTPVNGELIFVTDYELVSTSVTSINTTTETLTTTTAHGLSVNQQVKYIGATLNGLTENQVYFVLTAPTITTFTLSTTQGGSTLNITGSFTVDLVFAKTPTTAAGVPLGIGVAPLWIGDGSTVGGVVASALNLDDLLDVVITDPVTEGEFLWYDGTNWINTNEPTIDTNAKALNLTRRSTTAVQNYESAPAIILTNRVTDATNDNTDDAGPSLRFNRSSGTQSTKTYVSGGAISAFTVTLNNVTGLVVGNKVTGTGLPSGNGALITVIAGNQLTLDTAFTVQAAGTYTIGEPVAFGQVSMEYFGTTDIHKFRVTTTTDNFLESPVNVYPGTSVLIDSSKNATNINEGVLYVDKVNSRVGVNDTSPSFSLDVTGTANITSNLTVDTNTLFVDATNNRVGILNGSPTVALDVTGAAAVSGNLAVDTDTLFVNATTDRVGINNSSPGYELEINSSTGPGVDDEVQFAMTNGERTALFSNNTNGDLFSFSYPAGTNRLQFNLTNAYFPSGNLGINNSTPLYTLDVNGTANIETSLTVPSISTLTGDDLTITAFAGRDVTISTTTATDPVTIVRNTTATSTAVRTLTLRADTSNTPAIGFGNTLEYEVDTPAGIKAAAYISVSATNVTAGDESFNMAFGLMNSNDPYSTVMQVDSLGNLQIDGDLAVNGDDITTTQTTFNLLNGTATTVNAFGASTATAIGSTVSGTTTIGYDAVVNHDLTVTGDINATQINIDSQATIDTATLTTTSTATVALTTTAVRNAMTGLINIIQGTDAHCLNFTVLRTSASTAMLTTYAEMYDNISLGSFTADVSGGSLRLLITPASATSTVFSVVRTSLT